MKDYDDDVGIEKIPGSLGPPGKLDSWDFYKFLGNPKLILAPMVELSELPWRLLTRKYGADLCYTPMIHSKVFLEVLSEKRNYLTYRDEIMTNDPTDRPLIAQFCANDPELLLRAACTVVNEGFVDGVDLNLGCPQGIAKRGHYGAFLMEDWELIGKLIRTLHENLNVPVTAKIRVFDDLDKTIAYAKMVEQAGAQILTVHGRTRDMKGTLTGIADWNYIKAVKNAVSIPVFSNGNILYYEDIDRCLKLTGCDGVMVAESNLYNPCLFSKEKNKSYVCLGPSNPNEPVSAEFFSRIKDFDKYPLLVEHPPAHLICLEYLQDVIKSIKDTPRAIKDRIWSGAIKGHIFKVMRLNLQYYPAMFRIMSKCRSAQDLLEVMKTFSLQIEKDIMNPPPDFKTWQWEWLTEEGSIKKKNTETGVEVWGENYRILPYWVCQPYIRSIEPEQKSLEKISDEVLEKVVLPEDSDDIEKLVSETKNAVQVSQRLEYEKLRQKRKQNRSEQKALIREKRMKFIESPCTNCKSVASSSCKNTMCRNCCRSFVVSEIFRNLKENRQDFNCDTSNVPLNEVHLSACGVETKQKLKQTYDQIKTKFQEDSFGRNLSKKKKKEILCVCLWLFLFGEDLSFCVQFLISICSSAAVTADSAYLVEGNEDFELKKVAYLLSSFVFLYDESSSLMITNALIRDLESEDSKIVELALEASCKISNALVLEVLFPRVKSLLFDGKTSSAVVRRKCVRALFHITKMGSVNSIDYDKMVTKFLTDKDFSLMSSSLHWISYCLESNLLKNSDKLILPICHIITQIIDGKVSKDYLYYKAYAPWIHCDLITLLRGLLPKNSSVQDQNLVNVVFSTILKSMEMAKDGAEMCLAITFECSLALYNLYCYWSDTQKKIILDIFKKYINVFLSSSNGNLKHVGFDMLTLLTNLDQSVISQFRNEVFYLWDEAQEHETIDYVLEDKMLDLLMKMITSDNIIAVIEKLFLNKPRTCIYLINNLNEVLSKVCDLSEDLELKFKFLFYLMFQVYYSVKDNQNAVNSIENFGFSLLTNILLTDENLKLRLATYLMEKLDFYESGYLFITLFSAYLAYSVTFSDDLNYGFETMKDTLCKGFRVLEGCKDFQSFQAVSHLIISVNGLCRYSKVECNQMKDLTLSKAKHLLDQSIELNVILMLQELISLVENENWNAFNYKDSYKLNIDNVESENEQKEEVETIQGGLVYDWMNQGGFLGGKLKSEPYETPEKPSSIKNHLSSKRSIKFKYQIPDSQVYPLLGQESPHELQPLSSDVSDSMSPRKRFQDEERLNFESLEKMVPKSWLPVHDFSREVG